MIVSLCTPTYNRRLFIPTMLKCINNQTYPKDLIEWIILDDGEDKIEDLVCDVPYVKYYKIEKMNIGEKRNLINKFSKGDVLIYIDDDDYYPPERISHVVETLTENSELCVGSSMMHLYFPELDKIYEFGPYGKYHATAATLGFRRILLNKTAYNDNDSRAEEKFFLKKWTIPLKQLDPKKTILVIAHSKNTVDKTKLLKGANVKESDLQLEDFIDDQETISFYRLLKEPR